MTPNSRRIKVYSEWIRMPCVHCGCFDLEVEFAKEQEPKVFCCACGERLRKEDVGL